MSDTCETVKVKAENDQGYILINKSDMTKEHKAYEAQKSKKESKKTDKKVD